MIPTNIYWVPNKHSSRTKTAENLHRFNLEFAIKTSLRTAEKLATRWPTVVTEVLRNHSSEPHQQTPGYEVRPCSLVPSSSEVSSSFLWDSLLHLECALVSSNCSEHPSTGLISQRKCKSHSGIFGLLLLFWKRVSSFQKNGWLQVREKKCS